MAANAAGNQDALKNSRRPSTSCPPIDFTVRAFQIYRSQHSGRPVSRACEKNHREVVSHKMMGVEESEPWA